MNEAAEPANPPGSRKRRSRLGLFLPYILLLLIAIGIGIFWFVARDRVETAMDDWMAREATQGRQWSCPERAITGFPLRFEISCNRPTFTGVVDGQRISGEMAGLQAVAQIYDPNLAALNFIGPVTVRRGDGGETLRVGWTGLSMSVRRTSEAFSRLSVMMKRPVITVIDAAGGEQVLGQAEAWEMHLRPDPSAPAAEDLWDVASHLSRATSPVIDAFFGNQDSLTVEFQGGVNHALLFRRGAGPAQLDAWRDAGGQLRVALLKLTRGAQVIEARGKLGVDSQRRPAGQLEVQAAGVSELLARITGRRSGVVGGLLAGGLAMLGSQNRSGADAAQGPQTGPDGQTGPRLMALPPLVLANGQLMVGPFPVLRLPPLY